jgi:hypothetical protein
MTFLLFAGPSPSLANRFGLRRSHPSPIEKTNPQSVSFSLNGTQLRLAKLHVTHSKDETGPARGFRSLGNSFILNNMAERVGFEFTRKRSFNNIERTAGTVKRLEDNGKQC